MLRVVWRAIGTHAVRNDIWYTGTLCECGGVVCATRESVDILHSCPVASVMLCQDVGEAWCVGILFAVFWHWLCAPVRREVLCMHVFDSQGFCRSEVDVTVARMAQTWSCMLLAVGASFELSSYSAVLCVECKCSDGGWYQRRKLCIFLNIKLVKTNIMGA